MWGLRTTRSPEVSSAVLQDNGDLLYELFCAAWQDETRETCAMHAYEDLRCCVVSTA